MEAKTVIEGINEKLRKLEMRIEKLESRVKKLEQKDSYYLTEEEIRDFKIGGTD